MMAAKPKPKPKPPAAKPKAAAPQQTAQQVLESKYGAAYAVLTAVPELQTILLNAIKGNKPLPFDAVRKQIENSDWWLSNNQTFRAATVQKGTSPSDYAQGVENKKAAVTKLVVSNGLRLSDDQISKLAENAYMYGFSDDQILKSAVGDAVKVGETYSKGKDTGKANAVDLFDNATQFNDTSASNSLLAYAKNMGVQLSSADEATYRRRLASTTDAGAELENIKNEILSVSKSLYPPFTDLGTDDAHTLMAKTAGYRQLISQYLEIPLDQVDFSDPLLNLGKGLMKTDYQTGQVVLKTPTEFVDSIKTDGRWYNTQNAQDEYRGLANDFLTQMGFK